MSTGDCFHCHKPGHWANRCPLKSPTKITTVAAASPPLIHCPCDHGAACDVLTSKTVKNPDRRFYKCSAVPSCGFFKWCDQVNIKPQTISVNPTCPCGAGPCRRVRVIDGPNAQRSYFVCCIKKGFGACGFFQWENNDAQVPSEPEEVGDIGSPCSTLLGFSESDSTDLNSYASVNQVCKDRLETKEQVEDLCSNYTTSSDNMRFSGNERYSLEVAEAMSVPIGAYKTEQTIETEASFSGGSSLMDLIEQYNSEKLHFQSVSMQHVNALTSFTCSYKKLVSLRDKAHSLSKELLDVERQVNFHEADASEFAAILQEVCSEMTKSQNKMVGTAKRVAKELRGKGFYISVDKNMLRGTRK